MSSFTKLTTQEQEEEEMSCYLSHLSNYESQLLQLERRVLAQPSNKFSYLPFLYTHNAVLTDHLLPLYRKVDQLESESDFAITPLIRCLYYGEPGKRVLELRQLRRSTAVPAHTQTQTHIQTQTQTQTQIPTQPMPTCSKTGVNQDTSNTASHFLDTDAISEHFTLDHHHHQEDDVDSDSRRDAITDDDFFFSEPAPQVLNLSQAEMDEQVSNMKSTIVEVLSKFPFLPTKENIGQMNNIIFWSENHLFMTLGSAYLYFQYRRYIEGQQLSDYDSQQQIRVKELLFIYLRTHEIFEGCYEANSHVYLPFTICALLNLFDFAIDEDIVVMAEGIIDRINRQIMLCTDPLNGVANLSASARNFARVRQRNFNHGVNTLVKVMNGGLCMDPYGPSYMAGFLLTTSWRPKHNAFQALHGSGILAQSMLMSHDFDQTEDYYLMFLPRPGITSIDIIPLYWSAGLVVHPKYATRSLEYISEYGLHRNKDLWPLHRFFLTGGLLKSVMGNLSHFTTGQLYLGIRLNVFKMPGLVLSSFELYNPHKCGFQQSPWMANIGGVPIWSRSGLGSESVAGFGIHNTHNPAVQQRGSILLACYISPSDLRNITLAGSVLSDRVQLLWPEQFFENSCMAIMGQTFEDSQKQIEAFLKKEKEKRKQNRFKLLNTISMIATMNAAPNSSKQELCNSNLKLWFVGARGKSFVACHMTGKINVNNEESDEDFFQSSRTALKTPFTKIWSDETKVSIVVIVGHNSQFSNMTDFVNRRVCGVNVESSKDRIKVEYTNHDSGHVESISYPYLL